MAQASAVVLPPNHPNFNFRNIHNSERRFRCIVHGFDDNAPETYGSIEDAYFQVPDPRLRLFCYFDGGRLSVSAIRFAIMYYHGPLPVTDNCFDASRQDVKTGRITFETGTLAFHDHKGRSRYHLEALVLTKLHGRHKRLRDATEVRRYPTRTFLERTMKFSLVSWHCVTEDQWDVNNMINHAGGPGSEAARLIARLSTKGRLEWALYIRLSDHSEQDDFDRHTVRPLLRQMSERHPPLYPYDTRPSILNVGLPEYRTFRNGMVDALGAPGPHAVMLLPVMRNRINPRPVVVAHSIGEIREQQYLENSLISYVDNQDIRLILVRTPARVLGLGINQLNPVMNVTEPQDAFLYIAFVNFVESRSPRSVARRMQAPPDGTVFAVVFGAGNNAYGRVVRAIQLEEHKGTRIDFAMLMYLHPQHRNLASDDKPNAVWYAAKLGLIVNRLSINQQLDTLAQLERPTSSSAKSLQRVFTVTSDIYPREQSTAHLGPSPPGSAAERSRREYDWRAVTNTVMTWPVMTNNPQLSHNAQSFVSHAAADLKGRFCGAQASIGSENFRAVAANVMVMLGIKHKVMLVVGEQRDMPELCHKLRQLFSFAVGLAVGPAANGGVDWRKIQSRVTKYTASEIECKDTTTTTTWGHLTGDPFHPVRRRLNLYFDWALQDLPEQAMIHSRTLGNPSTGNHVPIEWSMGHQVQNWMRGQNAARIQDCFRRRAGVLDGNAFPGQAPQLSIFQDQAAREQVKGCVLREATDLLITDCKTAASELVKRNFRATVIVMIGADRVTLAEGLSALMPQDYQAVFVHGDNAMSYQRHGAREVASFGVNEAWRTWVLPFWSTLGVTNAVHLL